MDYILLQLGNPGRYQVFIAFLLCCLQIPITFSGHLWNFYSEEPPHRCYIPSWLRNESNENEWIPRIVTNKAATATTYDSCEMYIDVYAHWRGTRKCTHGWEYRPADGQHNPVIEWDLVCERKYLVTILYYISNGASILGCLIFGLIADRFERKPALLLALYLFVAVAFSMHFVQDFISFAISYCIQYFFVAGIQISSYVLLMEVMPSPYQLQASLYYLGFSIVSSMFLPLIMWLIASWRYIQIAIAAPGIVFFAHLWILPRSPLWLISEGKMVQTENLVETLGKQNGKPMPPSFRLHLQNFFNLIKTCDGLSAKRHNILSKFSSQSLRWYLLCHFYLFFVVYLSLNVTDSQVLRLHETKYADYFYRGLMDLGAVTLIYHASLRIGPRVMQSLLFILAGLLMMVAITLQELLTTASDRSVSDKFDYRLLLLPSTLVSGARTLMIILPIFVWYHTIKTLPTGVRAIGFACCYAWGIVGHMSAPNLLVLAELIAPFIPIGLCGSLSMIAGGLSLLFPDLWRAPLPNTLSDVENRASSRHHRYRLHHKAGKIDSSFQGVKKLNPKYFKAPPGDAGPIDIVDVKTEAKAIQEAEEAEMMAYMVNGATGGDLDCLETAHSYEIHQNGTAAMGRSSIVLSETQGSQITEIDEMMVVDNGNWHLYSPNDDPRHQHHQRQLMMEANRSFRDLQVFPKPNNGTMMPDNGTLMVVDNNVQNVSESKL